MKKYTLKDAFEKGFLWNKDQVDISRLYNTPPRGIGYVGKAYGDRFRIISISDIVYKISFCNPTDDNRPIGHVFLNNGAYTVEIAWELQWRFDDAEGATLLAGKFLTIEEVGIKATYSRDPNGKGYIFNITLPSDILVDFTDERVPYLELPEHTAYTLPEENL